MTYELAGSVLLRYSKLLSSGSAGEFGILKAAGRPLGNVGCMRGILGRGADGGGASGKPAMVRSMGSPAGGDEPVPLEGVSFGLYAMLGGTAVTAGGE